MKKIILLISLSIILAALVAPAYSSDQKKPDYSGHFGDMDLDGDDQLNWKEFKQYFPHAEEDVFKKIDANNDALVDHDEWHEFKEAQGYEHKE